ncbi:Dynein alpha chain [Durusdinium trenchii]|uniref:Flagellar outer arm (DHC alpha) n=1 Tax=Durusdinium trenchii TaxID=1381693 RepID=A0ABP0RT69_9DINO
MPAHPFQWTRLKNSGNVSVSPRAGHTITLSSVGFLLYGGMDGRRNDQGNPAPNSDLYLLKVGGKTFQWEQVEVDPGSQLPPARTLHTALAISQDEVFVFGGIHSATPDRVLNDGWILDTGCYEWKHVGFKTQSEDVKSSHWKRLSGKILEHPYVAAQAEVIGQGESMRRNTGTRRISGMAQTARSAVSGLNFETLALAASKAVVGASMSIGGESGGDGGSSRKSWKKFLAKQMTSSVKAGDLEWLACRWTRFQPKDEAGLVNFEEEQFLEDPWTKNSSEFADFWNEDEDASKGPAPRGNHSTCLYENTIILFGGHGGFGYQRKAFNDVWALNLDSFRWTELLCHGNPPAPRSGHCAFQKDGFVYIFGGWNGESQFNDLFMLDVENKDWSDVDLNWSVPRWNMAVQLVEAIPSWRVFVFGGSADRHGEGRTMGSYDRELGVLDLGDERSWLSLSPERAKLDGASSRPDKPLDRPPPREHTAIVYDAEESRLILYGGWANKWLDDCWQIDVSSIVGPPYAIVKVEPSLGPVSGSQKVQIFGVGFLSVPGVAVIRFTGGNGKSVEAQGTILDDELVECLTPKAEGIGPRSCEVRIAIGVKDFTTTMAEFQYFMNTVPERSLCYGPGLLMEQQAESTTRFRIQARNQAGDNRKSGRDEWVIQVQHVYVNEKGKESLRELPHEIIDFDTGQYEVRYIPEPGDLIIRVSMVDELGKPRPIRGSPFKASSIQYAKNRANEYLGPIVHSWLSQTLKSLDDFYRSTETGQGAKLNEEDVKGLIKVMNHIQDLYKNESELIRLQDCIYETLAHIEREGVPVEKQLKSLKKVCNALVHLRTLCHSTEQAIQPMVQVQSEIYKGRIAAFEQSLRSYQAGLKQEAYYYYRSGVELAFQRIQTVTTHLDMKTAELEDLHLIAKNFDYPDEVKESFKIMNMMREDVALIKSLWDHEVARIRLAESYLVKRWGTVDALQMEDDIKTNFKKLKEYKVDKRLDVYTGMQEVIKRWVIFCPLVAELLDPSMRPRHWMALVHLCGKSVDVSKVKDLLLRDMWTLELYKHPQEVEEIGEQAKQESKMEGTIAKLHRIWSAVEFVYEKHKGSDVMLMHLKDEDVETLEENQVQVQNMFASRFLSTFEEQVLFWQKTLASISETSSLLSEVIRTWVFLENLFIHSEEVKKELPDETERFMDIDEDVKALLARGYEARFAKQFCCEPSIYRILEKTQQQLLMCEKALNEFMDGKRQAFPRFYFMSSADLLDVLSNGNNPARVVHHFPKFFNAIEKYDLEFPDGPTSRPYASGLHAAIGKEYVPFFEALHLVGKVEMYLERCIETFRTTLRHFALNDLRSYAENDCQVDGPARGKWLLGVKAAQGALLVQLITWVQLVESAFQAAVVSEDEAILDEQDGQKKVEEAWRRQQELLLDLIRLTQTDLDKPARQKVMCAITLDAHNRDVQERLVRDKVTSADAFQWQSMLKSYWILDEEHEANAQMQICDARIWYAYEYLGNGPRLVVTPLTDRIYVTATQALHLHMGCAPAGPAGTGKTESTKDLANALARACYVINAAPEMDYLTLGNIFKGLAASGSWGCFDEFNRLVPEVLSVCTVQFKAVCDALRQHAARFILQGDEIQLDRGVGVFITMNPGYLGRSELPEGLKALFRPITVMVPDFMLIMENMFMSEGFLDAKKLALKFSTLYALNKDLLSKSNKYDWGMRAIKSVLVVAGGFKRADPRLSEQAVLMRSLRDTNVAKIEGDDLKIFMGLLADLFPGVQVPRARDTEFEEIVVDTMENEFGFTNDPDGYLLLKISQLIELLDIRHSVFLMGNPGSFKSFLWKVLKNAKTKRGDKTTVVDFSPKAISTNELYGSVNMHTREWKDGILSKTMRDLGQIPDTHPKWIMLDGDLDANWIESMNSVMDDSRLLTLPSNERIPLKLHMKMIFEIRDLNYATPATATRAGIVCMSDKEGVQWQCYVKSWVKKLSYSDTVKEQLSNFFQKYCPPTLAWIRKTAKLQVPYVEISLVSSLCSLLDARLTSQNLESLETWFAFSTIFATGSCLAEVDGVDYRKAFSNWWKTEMKTVKYPTKGLVFDLYVRDMRLEEWSGLVEPIHYRSTTPMGEITVPTTETVCLDYFMRALIEVQHPVMLIGLAGCGKTQSCTGLLKKLNHEVFMGYKMNMSYYTDSAMLQTMMEIPLEKKAGKLYAPPGKLQMIYFIDDLNMPALDKYNTQSAIELIKQKQDYNHWYDRAKIQIKDIGSTQYLCCMNPTAGSFTVNQRLQRHFWTCSVQFPEQNALNVIYATFMKGHFDTYSFKVQVQEIANWVIKASLSFHTQVSATFRKTAKNMHYEFNIRHMSGVFAGLLKAKPSEFNDAEKLVLLWIHESERIYGDRLVCHADLKKLRHLTEKISKQMFSKHNLQKYFQEKNPEPIIFAPFSRGHHNMDDGGVYDKIKDMERLSQILHEAMADYDSTYAAMDLVLFEDAMKHVARICRIISSPSGHPLLVGVGGSGRQSLSRLSAFVCQHMTYMIVITSSYSLPDLKTDLQYMYKRAGEKDEGVMFLFTDNQIANERFFVFFNDLLASGEITDLYPSEDKDSIRNAVRSAAKGLGIVDTPENLWAFYISRVRKNLHMSLCFSPVGDGLWSRARRFPALVNCTTIDWLLGATGGTGSDRNRVGCADLG